MYRPRAGAPTHRSRRWMASRDKCYPAGGAHTNIVDKSGSREGGEVTKMNESKELLTTTQKARTINFDAPLYGTFAEIGAGQEVAREFFHAGGASGTIAKSISAYDMVFGA